MVSNEIQITPQPFLVITTKNSQRTPLPILLSQGLSFRSTCHCPSMRYMVQQLCHSFRSRRPRILGGHSLFDTHALVSEGHRAAAYVLHTPLSTREISLGKPPRFYKPNPSQCCFRSASLSNSQVNKSSQLIYYWENVVVVICPALRAISSPSCLFGHYIFKGFDL